MQNPRASTTNCFCLTQTLVLNKQDTDMKQLLSKSHIQGVRQHHSFWGGKTGQVDCMVFFTTYQIFKMKFTLGDHGAQTVQHCPTATVNHDEHENHEWRRSLVWIAIFHWDKSVFHRVLLHSSKCAYIEGRVGAIPCIQPYFSKCIIHDSAYHLMLHTPKFILSFDTIKPKLLTISKNN